MSDWEFKRRKRDEKRRAAVMALPVLPVRQHGTITGVRDDDVLVSSSIGPAGEAVALWSTAEDAAALTSAATEPGGPSFPSSTTERPVAAQVTVQHPELRFTVPIAELTLAHPSVQVLPGERILVVAARCRWRPDGPERNAIVYAADGRVVTEQTLGDGIGHVLATGAGEVWVGYFDEGIYGNYGWGHDGAPAPLGAPGLVRFSADLEPAWRYPSHVDNPWGAIDDCYALNLAGDTAWTCYYSDFSLVRIQDGTLTGWRNTLVHGATALAVDGTRVALFGGYGPDRDRLVLADLGHGQLRRRAEYRLTLPDGSPLPAAQVVGRGPHLHVLAGRAWFRLDLDDIRKT